MFLLVSYFEVTIPELSKDSTGNEESLDYLRRSSSPRLGEANFESILANVNHFAAVTMFVERGLLSGHCYQPDINHRQINFNSFADTYETDGQIKPSLSDSMVYPTRENSFSAGNPMALYCYQVRKMKDPIHKLYSRSLKNIVMKWKMKNIHTCMNGNVSEMSNVNKVC